MPRGGKVGRPANAHNVLEPQDRVFCGWLASMDLWPKKDIAEAFGVSVRTVRKHELRYGNEVWGGVNRT